MNFKKNYKVYHTTTDNRTFKLCHFAHNDLCCMACVKRHRRKAYEISNFGKFRDRFPNWKLVSKNKKQWMKKPLKTETKELRWGGTYTKIYW